MRTTRCGVPVMIAPLLLALFLPGGGARATTVLPLSMADLVQRSDVVAHVRVGAVRVVRTAEAPFRVTEIEVVEPFLGARRAEVFELWQRGDGRVFVVCDPWLEPGQEGLAFLRQVDGRTYLTALAQSWWRIEDQAGGAVARRDISGLVVVTRDRTVMMPPDQNRWTHLRQLVLRACEEVP